MSHFKLYPGYLINRSPQTFNDLENFARNGTFTVHFIHKYSQK